MQIQKPEKNVLKKGIKCLVLLCENALIPISFTSLIPWRVVGTVEQIPADMSQRLHIYFM